ncbi:MAG: hypothetical protein GQ531_04715 [Sulfurovum sp.]|nr:hypothetical protein [Sulfurovum sp.]
MLKSEKKSLVRFLLIYLGSTFLLFSITAWVFYTSQHHHLLDEQRDGMKLDAAKIIGDLRKLHGSYEKTLQYPVLPLVDSSIYDVDKNYIFGTGSERIFMSAKETMYYEKKLYYLSEVQPYYLGAAYLLLSKELNEVPIQNLQRNVLQFILASGIIFALLGLFLGRLFIAPMRESMERMNRFIQDTTHELNTPISTILTNIEMLETFGSCGKNAELDRIEIASKTLSRIYADLTYLNLNHQHCQMLETVNVSTFIKERMHYFNSMAMNKQLKIEMDIEENVILEIDKNDLTRLIDNLISNAIKYNKKEGSITLRLRNSYLCVQDTGIGIRKQDLDSIVCRFRRANDSEGGFGIGLDIVSQIVESYAFTLTIESEERKGTKVVVKW